MSDAHSQTTDQPHYFDSVADSYAVIGGRIQELDDKLARLREIEEAVAELDSGNYDANIDTQISRETLTQNDGWIRVSIAGYKIRDNVDALMRDYEWSFVDVSFNQVHGQYEIDLKLTFDDLQVD